MFGFCMDGDKDCVYWHPKPGTPAYQNAVPQYKDNECLPQEYLDKVQKFFDDSQITNVNMIQILMKQMSQKIGVFSQPATTEQMDLQSLRGMNRFTDAYSGTDTFNNSAAPIDVSRKSSMYTFGINQG